MGVTEMLREFRQELESLYGDRLKDIVLYGSWARGDATEDSDSDVVIILEGRVIPGKEIDRMIDIITENNLKNGTLLSVYPVSEEDYSTINSPLLLNARREGVPV
ncbi:MAG: nucleotidyltransferase domain-containing protein [bacterium]